MLTHIMIASFYVWFLNRMTSGIARHALVCRTFYVSYAAIVQCLLTSVEVVLMLRGKRHSCCCQPHWCDLFM